MNWTSLWFLLCCCLFLSGTSSFKQWNWIPEDEHPCTVRQRFSLTQVRETFGPRGIPPLYPNPVIIVNDDDRRNSYFRNVTRREELLAFFGPNFNVTLSSSNSLSERRRNIPLEQYLDEIQTSYETTPDKLSNETWYLFGETYTTEWQRLLQHYELPPCYTCALTTDEYPTALAFGIGNRGSGVQWHQHGPGFSEAVHGRKHWVLYPPDTRPPRYHKDQSSRQWMENVYNTAEPKPEECTLNPGDLIYFPDRWWHATINLDPYTVFVSSFTTEHGITVENGVATDHDEL